MRDNFPINTKGIVLAGSAVVLAALLFVSVLGQSANASTLGSGSATTTLGAGLYTQGQNIFDTAGVPGSIAGPSVNAQYITGGTFGAGGYTFPSTVTVTSDLYANGTYVYGDNKTMLQYSDTWLRINPGNAFTSGIYANTGIFRTDGTLQVGASGATLNVVSGGDFNYKSGALFAQYSTGRVGIGTASPAYPLDVAGEIHTNNYVSDITGKLARNLLDTSTWTISNDTIGNWTAQQTASGESQRVWGTDPFGRPTIIWNDVTNAGNDASGGWIYSGIPINPNKAYRYTVWVMRVNATAGSVYLGADGSNTLNLNGTSNNNPYFFSFPAGSLTVGRWYLLVGYMHANNDSSVTNYSEVYDGVTGQAVISGTDYKNAAAATTQTHRSFSYYNTAAGTTMSEWGPRFEEINGSEPSIESLLGESQGSTNGNVSYFGGNVGIGKTPSTALDVNGTVTATAFSGPLTGNLNASYVTAGTFASGNFTFPSQLSISGLLNVSGSGITVAPGGSDGGTQTWLYQIGSSPWTTHLVSTQLSFDTGANSARSARLTIDSSGNSAFTGSVGIGTGSPARLLDVNGAARFSGAMYGANPFSFYTDGSAAQVGSFGGLLIGTSYDSTPIANQIRTSSNQSLDLDARGTGNLTFSTADAVKMTILNGGSIGIGTASPSAKLYVAGGSYGSVGSANNASYALGAQSIAADASIYSYGPICTGNSSGNCTGSNGVVIGSSNTTASVNITNTGSLSIGTQNTNAVSTAFGVNDIEAGGWGGGSGSTQFAHTAWAEATGLLFNAYQKTSHTGADTYLFTTGNTAYMFNGNAYSYAAGALAFISNGGTWQLMTAPAEPNGSGANTDITWGNPVLSVDINGNGTFKGTVTATGFSGPLTGNINASYVTPGTYPSGNYTYQGILTANSFSGVTNVFASNEMDLANGFTGGTLWLNYRGASGSGVTNLNIANGLSNGGLAQVSASQFNGNLSASYVTAGTFAAGNFVFSNNTTGAVLTVNNTYGSTGTGQTGISVTGGQAVYAGATANSYALYATGGNTTNSGANSYAIYAVPGTGTGAEYAAYFGGAVGLGTTAPDGLQSSVSVAETARGVDNIRLGVAAGSPRMIFEDATYTQWEIDNSAGTFRWFQPGTVYLSLSNSGGGTLSVGGGAGKVTAATIDPPYTIGGVKYATYAPSMTGVNEETSGVAVLKNGSYSMDLMNSPAGSDLWLFGRVTNLKDEGLKNVTVLLTPNFAGKVWYEKNEVNGVITIYGDKKSGEVSYRLTAPRFDHEGSQFVNTGVNTFGNLRPASDDAEGLNLDKLLRN